MKHCHLTILLAVFLSFTNSVSRCQTDNFKIGINLCGAEFGFDNLPGTINKDYTYPTEKEIDYFANKGFKIMALPFRWERIQHKINGELDTAELQEIKNFIRKCSNYNVQVSLTMQNFAVYHSVSGDLPLGSRHLSYNAFKDVWKKIAIALAEFQNVYGFDIMNEPRQIFGKKWFKAAQHAIDGIREVDTVTHIIVDGENSSFTYDWKFDNHRLRKLKDPIDKIIYDAHCYFDYDHSGTYDNKFDRSIDANMGVEKVKPFVDWLKKYKKKGIIGEFGVPDNNNKWLEVMDNFLAYIYSNGISANYWAGGPWWNDYPLSIQPVNGKERPQMSVLQKYLR